jgi:hypothetical protein
MHALYERDVLRVMMQQVVAVDGLPVPDTEGATNVFALLLDRALHLLAIFTVIAYLRTRTMVSRPL